MTCIITALDFARTQDATRLVERLDPTLTRVKIGNELFTLGGPALVEHCQKLGFDVFLDLKYHDIPNTVAKAVAAAGSLGVWMVNLHAGGGLRMMLAAREALVPYSGDKGTRLIGVTVLTSLDADELQDIGFAATPAEQAVRFATQVADAGLDGVVCSAHEAAAIKAAHGSHFLTVTPGVRPTGSVVTSSGKQSDDQRRVMTPIDAINNGSDDLVIGRPITQAKNPGDVLSTIHHEIQSSVASAEKNRNGETV